MSEFDEQNQKPKEIEQIEAIYNTDYEVGQDNVEAMGMDIHHPVFAISATLIVLFVVVSLMFPEASSARLGATKGWIEETFNWLFLSAGNLFVLFCLALIVLPFGKVRLGGQEAKPEFAYLSWFAMLFAAGMGIGLMFYGVAEPAYYFGVGDGQGPLNAGGGSTERALGATMYHWGLHPWAIYGVVALSLAFFCYNKGMPLTIRSTFYPILGDRVWGWMGHVIDILAVLATLFGLATSLGLGASQAASGMSFLFESIEDNLMTQISIIIGVTAIAVISVIRGIHGGVRVLSNFNMFIAAALLLFTIFAGGIIAFATNAGSTVLGYAQNFLPLSNPVGREDSGFYNGWTIFYWAWWISWSPFVGMFIARVSYGRTVREFMSAVLIVPVIVTVIWMTAFGGAGIDQMKAGVGELANEVDFTMSLFHMLDQLPMAAVTSFLAIVLVLVFFITSSDSGSLVIDSITAGGKLDAPVPQRIFWAVTEGAVAGVLLAIGGSAALDALQAGAVSTGLPFVLVLLVMCVSLAKALNHELTLIKHGHA